MQDEGSAFSFQPHQSILGLLGPFRHEHAIAGLLGTDQPFLDCGCDSPQQLHMQPPNPQALLFFNQPSCPFTGRLGDLFAFILPLLRFVISDFLHSATSSCAPIVCYMEHKIVVVD